MINNELICVIRFGSANETHACILQKMNQNKSFLKINQESQCGSTLISIVFHTATRLSLRN